MYTEEEITFFHALRWRAFLYDKKSCFGMLTGIENLSSRILNSALKILKPVEAVDTKRSHACLQGVHIIARGKREPVGLTVKLDETIKGFLLPFYSGKQGKQA